MQRIATLAGRMLRFLFGTRTRLVRTGAALCALYLLAVAGLHAGQRALIFRNGPERPAPPHFLSDARERTVTAPDGTRLVLWTIEPEGNAPVILYFHGNAGVMQHRAGRFEWMRGQGWGVVALAYRGSGGSGGEPSEAAFAMDARAIHDALPALLETPVPPERVVLYGESLGSGVAVTLASERPVGGVILETPYAALDDLTQEMFPIVPIKAFGMLRDPFRSIDRIDRIDAPLLVMHGTWDRVIPIRHARRLFEAAEHPKWYRWFGQGRHHDLWARGARESIAGFMDRSFSAPPSATPRAEAPPR